MDFVLVRPWSPPPFVSLVLDAAVTSVAIFIIRFLNTVGKELEMCVNM